MSLPRELRIRDGKLLQTPITGIETLRSDDPVELGLLPPACELEIRVLEGDFDLNLFTRADGTGGLRLHYDREKGLCTLDRSGMDKRFNTQVFETLDMPLEQPLRSLRIFIDRSSAELFFNDGEAVFTTHVYPTQREFHWNITENAAFRMWPMSRSVTDEFVV